MKIVIVGAGISGLMCAYRLASKLDMSEHSITILEKGNSLEDRHCPIVMKESEKCLKCKRCAITNGVAGAGAFSDGKYNLTTQYGGWLNDYIGRDLVWRYINEADEILDEYDAKAEIKYPDNDLKYLFSKYGLEMLQGTVKHLGTDNNYNTMVAFVSEIKAMGVNIISDVEVTDITKRKNGSLKVVCNRLVIPADKVILAVGRTGNKFIAEVCERHNIPLLNNKIDLGVRVELPHHVWESISNRVYEPKLLYTSKKGYPVRTFCFNSGGEVVYENTEGIVTVNGHSYVNTKTDMDNFALLVTMYAENPLEYGTCFAKASNVLSKGTAIVQSFEDFVLRKATTEETLESLDNKPSLKGATPGNLWNCLPYDVCEAIEEMINKMDEVVRGNARKHTLLYGVEVKYYSMRPQFKKDFELFDNVYAIGDGAGVTRSLSQAAANGLYLADSLLKQI